MVLEKDQEIKRVVLPADSHARIKSVAASKRITLLEASKQAVDEWVEKNSPKSSPAQ